ncbi:MAG: alkane 1-monooxygenase [Chitinophagaceae bacterium]|nr:alkane 1-monooxygenase [Chitinophagaceae bacterium]
MRLTAIKYFTPLLIYLGAVHSFFSYGPACFALLIYSWIVIPFLELFIEPDPGNLSEAEEEIAKHDKLYDWILYAIVLLQVPVLFLFLYSMQDDTLTWLDRLGRIGTMGMLCGVFGINVGHELGHRVNGFEKVLAKLSLMTSLYMHFFIEHNKGHHKNVATPGDPSSARYGEPLYRFWFRTVFYSYASAWRIANCEREKQNKPVWSLKNEMVQAHIIQAGFLLLIYFSFGVTITCYYLVAAIMGILLLETVNYIEHYGLTRKQIAADKYERALPSHSWNSNHVVGRLMLFELSRHSDHHYLASRKYQVLQHHEDAPQMPTGYPGMMLLSLLPPVWFLVMNKKIKRLHKVLAI